MKLSQASLQKLGFGLDMLAEAEMSSPTLAFRIARARKNIAPLRQALRERELQLALQHVKRKDDGSIAWESEGVAVVNDPEDYANERAELLSQELEVPVDEELDLKLLESAQLRLSPRVMDSLMPILKP